MGERFWLFLAVGVLAPLIALMTACGHSSTASARRAAVAPSAAADVDFAGVQLRRTLTIVPQSAYPYLATQKGWSTTSAAAWTSGFFPGSLWLMYRLTKDKTWASEAGLRQAGIAGRQTDTGTHDVGFRFETTFVQGYELTGDRAYLNTALTAARSLATRYNANVGAIKSLDTLPDFNVLIDSMMNVELLFWAADHGGGQDLRTIAIRHALTVRANNVRPDGSTYQMVVFDPATGRVRSKQTVQGLNANSTWSRGQAWGMTGFTTVYRETRDSRFLVTARQLADYFLAHLPADHVPLWDFAAPAGDPKDSSAAAIAASGLMELARLDPDASRRARYLTAGKMILDALSAAPYRSSASGPPSIILQGTQNKPKGVVDTGLVYGDYYYLQALSRYLKFKAPTSPAPRQDRTPPKLSVTVRRRSGTLRLLTVRASSERSTLRIAIRHAKRTRTLRRTLRRGERLTLRLHPGARIVVRATDARGNRTVVQRVLTKVAARPAAAT